MLSAAVSVRLATLPTSRVSVRIIDGKDRGGNRALYFQSRCGGCSDYEVKRAGDSAKYVKRAARAAGARHDRTGPGDPAAGIDGAGAIDDGITVAERDRSRCGNRARGQRER